MVCELYKNGFDYVPLHDNVQYIAKSKLSGHVINVYTACYTH